MFVGIDIGTSSVKAVLIDDDDRALAEQSQPLDTQRPRPLWYEQSPESWWSATAAVLDRLVAAQPALMGAVRALGLTGQMLGVTLLDRADQPLRPAILWNDGRASAECEALERRIAGFADLVGCRAMPGFPAPKILWLARHEPATLRATKRVLLTKDYVRLHLTGEAVSDVADASATLLMDTRAGTWSVDIAEACGISVELLPRLVACGAPSGTLRPELARRWGMRDGVPVAGGAGDNMCAALGARVIHRGDACISIGTSGVYLVANDAFVPAQGCGLHTHRYAVPGLFAQQGCVLSAASALTWLCSLLAVPDAGALIAKVEAADLAPDDVPVFTPYLSGERTPHNDPLATAAISGLRITSGPLELGRAVLDGVALAIADCQDALRADGAPIERVVLIGGGARSRLWAEIIATATGQTLHVPPHASLGPALGAARLARQCMGGPLIAERSATRGDDRIEPRSSWIDAYERKRDVFRRHYAMLNPVTR
jgi:xylulokinase